jgi:ADP-ribosylglycohydrolase
MSTLVKQRVMAAIRGAFIADAASMGTHWIYSPKEMAESVLDQAKPEFRNPPTPRYYSSEEFEGHYKFGMLSPYGEQMLFVTEYLARGDFSGDGMSKAMLKWSTSFGGRPDSALKQFMENMQKDEGQWPNCGADDDQGSYKLGNGKEFEEYTLTPC